MIEKVNLEPRLGPDSYLGGLGYLRETKKAQKPASKESEVDLYLCCNGDSSSVLFFRFIPECYLYLT